MAKTAEGNGTGRELGSLVLSRRLGEVIQIGETVTITVIRANSGGAVLQIVAPKALGIWRQEILLAGEGSDQDGAEAPPDRRDAA